MRAYIFDGSVSEVVEVLETFERLKAEFSTQNTTPTVESKPVTVTSGSAPKQVSAKSKAGGGSTKTVTKSKRRKPPKLGAEPKEKFVSTELIERVFGRIPITGSMSELLKKLVSIDDGVWVSTSQLCKMMNFTPRQLQGILVSLRRRVAFTDGYQDDHHFLDSQLDKETDEYNFRIPSHLRSAVQRAVK